MERDARTAIIVGAVIAVAVAGMVAYILTRPAPPKPPEPADIGIVELSASPSTVALGGEVEVSVLVRNDGGVKGSEAFSLTVNGEMRGREIISLGPGESGILSFPVTGRELGTCRAELEQKSDTFKVVEPTDIRVTGLSVDPPEVEKGKTVKATVGVKNFGQMPGAERIELSIDNENVAREVRLEGGESENLSFGIERGPGEYTVSVGARRESFRVFEPPKEAIGVIEVNFPINWDILVDYVNSMVNYSLEEENVRAVVLKVSSPGGASAYIEEIYRNLLELKREKPVVTCIVGIGASGGYYISLPSDHLYAEPSAWVGSIGVYSTKPSVTRPRGVIYETGPYKRTLFSVKRYPLRLEDVLGRFTEAVEERRGENLKLLRREMIRGKIYHGGRAAEKGLIDSTGSMVVAKRKAASLAGVENYGLINVGWQVLTSSSTWLRTRRVRALLENYADRERWSDKLTPELLESLDPRFFYLHGVGGERIRSNVTILDEWSGKSADRGVTLPELGSKNPDSVQENWELKGGPAENLVLVDAAHLNAFEDEEINPLLQELVEGGAKMEYFTGLSLEEELGNANAFVTISPRTDFTEEEVVALGEFVEGGGKLLMVADPTRSDMAPINSLGKNFGTTFTPGYLYNMENHYGIYRNVYVENMENVEVLGGVERLALLTATEVSSAGSEIATTSGGTYLSTSEESESYGVMSLSENGSVLAVGDFTLMTRPWNTLECNSQFVSNLANFLTEVEAPARRPSWM
ncbi:hypothetical protein AKJ57_04185 [candidate division MSBL1 archaeon SCGC-AAA259A05]|uniref:Peptidase S49 domain-containing protein n=1 Tax=candidate division MSBL1 archaeon SCGC-AAA259A05 TaxID=1698259 RepID=A0A133U8D1_9EURY|nr:hypothetical protein AKJ57_04185 [candidate division MSBL1 archaeon SCGC-AAA259A05]